MPPDSPRFTWRPLPAEVEHNGHAPGRGEVTKELREEIAAGLRRQHDLGHTCPWEVVDHRDGDRRSVCRVFRSGRDWYAYAVVERCGWYVAIDPTARDALLELAFQMIKGTAGAERIRQVHAASLRAACEAAA
jgi:hypothetical protein